MLDDELRQAAQDLRHQIEAIEPPPFKAKSDFGKRIVLVAASVAVFAAAGLLVTVRQDDTTAPADSTTSSVDDPEPGPDTTTPTLTVEEPGPVAAQDDLVDLSSSGFVTDTAHRPATEMARPTRGAISVEPQFNTKLSAVTDATTGQAFMPIPGAAASWNIDGSLLVLYETGGAYGIYDGTSFDRLRDLTITPVDLEQVMWDPVDPEQLYYISDGELIAHQVLTAAETAVHRFDGCDEVDTETVGRPFSSDGQRLAVRCQSATGTSVIAYNLTTKEELRIPVDEAKTTLTPTPVGTNYLLVLPSGTIQILDAVLQPTGVEFDAGVNDAAVVATDSGRQFYATTRFAGPSIGSLIAYDLATGEVVVAIGESNGFPYPPAGHDITGSLANNGLVAISIEGQVETEAQGSLDGELLIVDFNQAEPATYRLGRHRTSDAVSGLDDYFSDPFIDLSPNGDRLLFSSSWGQDRVDTFVIDLTGIAR